MLNIFPLDKTYDGDKWETKDYFFSMDLIKEYGIDTPVNDGTSFLWDYMNMETRDFLINTMSITDRIRNLQGYPSAAEKFADDQGIGTFKKYTDNKGRNFFLDSNGKTIKAKKQYPKYLKLIR